MEEGNAPTDFNEMRDMMRKLNQKKEQNRTQRKVAEKGIQSAVDKRTLRAKGRTEQFNTNIRPDIKDEIAKQIPRRGIADWVERVFEEALGMRAAQ
jgi:hypothetical protein